MLSDYSSGTYGSLSEPLGIGEMTARRQPPRMGPESMVVVSQFNGTSTPKGSYSAKTGDSDATSIQVAIV